MLDFLTQKVKFVKIHTLKLHKIEPIVRIASSLSCVEILTALYYGRLIKYNPQNPLDDGRDRMIISKGHGSICLYPILADLGFFDMKELDNIGAEGSFLGTIPEPIIPGYETINGSLGHGLGVACGSAFALKTKKANQNVIVLSGDGELNEGSVWEGVMFAAQHCLDNLTLIVDKNKASMLGFTKDIIDLNPLTEKFKAFQWEVFEVDEGHSVEKNFEALAQALPQRNNKPKVVIAHTIKGNGVDFLERHPLSHILSIKPNDIDKIVERIESE